MARRKAKRSSSSGAPGIKNGPGIGPALNPLGLTKNNYLDPTVAAAEHVTPWQSFWADESKVQAFAQPVQPRR